ncbi:hypothetical protein BYT27DRAFT_7230870 [Phlegmacium glaucopus]|nr:hypothetical protein BYT27DRAFT_7230870 [Phlegmacium glaucopus]
MSGLDSERNRYSLFLPRETYSLTDCNNRICLFNISTCEGVRCASRTLDSPVRMLRPTLLVISRARVASLNFLIHDICITFDDEVNSIWSKPNDSWIKWHFLFTRYFALAAQITNGTIDHDIIPHIGIAKTALRYWYLCQALVGTILMLAVELVLMARVYALYKKNVWVGCSFAVLILGKVTAVVVGFVMDIPEDHVDIAFVSSSSYILFGICAIISQITILSLTLVKYWTAIREGWSAIPIMALVVRDGIVIFIIFIIVTILTVVANSTHSEYGSIGNSWLLSIAPCAGCRLVINMQHFSRQPERSTAVELTTVWNE